MTASKLASSIGLSRSTSTLRLRWGSGPCGWRDRERAASWSNFQHLAHQGAANVRPQPDISEDHSFAFLHNLHLWRSGKSAPAIQPHDPGAILVIDGPKGSHKSSVGCDR